MQTLLTRPHYYYNEFDDYAAQWIRNLIAKRLIPAGEVDERSIVDVAPDDLRGFSQCHFFAGIAGWALAARIAGWPEERELWTGSTPCQPFSVAGKQLGQADERHLWPHYFRLIAARRPAVAMGEQVAAAVGKDWLDGVFTDLEGIGYACGAAVVPACAVNGPHRRDRLWFLADRDGPLDHGLCARLEGHAGHGDGSAGRSQPHRPVAAASRGGDVGYSNGAVCERQPGELSSSQARVGSPHGALDGNLADRLEHASQGRDRPLGGTDGVRVGERSVSTGATQRSGEAAPSRALDPCYADGVNAWSGSAWIIGHDGKARRVEPSIPLLAHGVPSRVGRLRAYGNAIVPQVAAEVIAAYMECRP